VPAAPPRPNNCRERRPGEQRRGGALAPPPAAAADGTAEGAGTFRLSAATTSSGKTYAVSTPSLINVRTLTLLKPTFSRPFTAMHEAKLQLLLSRSSIVYDRKGGKTKKSKRRHNSEVPVSRATRAAPKRKIKHGA